MRLALFRYFKESTYASVKTEEEAKITQALRVSEWVEVDFPPCEPNADSWDRIAQIERTVDAKRKEHAAEIARLTEQQREIAAEQISA